MVFCNTDEDLTEYKVEKCHNPYFNRWFSAIQYLMKIMDIAEVTILILIDGFLQYL